jgi:hypothetical protein
MSQFFEPRGTRGCVFIVSYTKTSYRRFLESHSFLTLQNYTVNITLAYSFIPHHSVRMSHYVNLNLPAPPLPFNIKRLETIPVHVSSFLCHLIGAIAATHWLFEPPSAYSSPLGSIFAWTPLSQMLPQTPPPPV